MGVVNKVDMAFYEISRQHNIPDDNEEKLVGYGRLKPIDVFYDAAIQRLHIIREAIGREEYLPNDEVRELAILDRYWDECEPGAVIDDLKYDMRDQAISEFDGRAVVIKSSDIPYKGVKCDSYEFVGDDTEDLAIIYMKPGAKTPIQRVLGGERTAERFVSGSGSLLIGRLAGRSVIQYDFEGTNQGTNHDHVVEIGQTMQWSAGPRGLTVAESCKPPYESGRFEDL